VREKIMTKEQIIARLLLLEKLWEFKRCELMITRDWRIEAELKFSMIDLKSEHSRLKKLLSTASTVE
jgi:hypothetical protein